MRTLSRFFSTGASRDFGTILDKEGSLAAPQNLEPKMNARKEIRDYLLASRMKHWLQIARCPLVNLRCPTWRARKNYWALQRRYPELAKQLGLTETSVFDPVSAPSPSAWQRVAQNEGSSQANYYQHPPDYEHQLHGQRLSQSPAHANAEFAQQE